jgi:hypothetical protein
MVPAGPNLFVTVQGQLAQMHWERLFSPISSDEGDADGAAVPTLTPAPASAPAPTLGRAPAPTSASSQEMRRAASSQDMAPAPTPAPAVGGDAAAELDGALELLMMDHPASQPASEAASQPSRRRCLGVLLEEADHADDSPSRKRATPPAAGGGRELLQNHRCTLALMLARASDNSGICADWMAEVGASFESMLDNAREALGQLAQQCAFKIGICVDPGHRFSRPDCGYEQHGYTMYLLAASFSGDIARLETLLIDEQQHLRRTASNSMSLCENRARGGGGRSPPGTVSFCYLVVKHAV